MGLKPRAKKTVSSYSEELSRRIANVFGDHPGVQQKKMFGGLAFMVNGNMCCGVTSSDFMVRVGPEAYAQSLALPHARPMDFTGRPLTGFVFVEARGIQSDRDLAAWVGRGLDFAGALPAK